MIGDWNTMDPQTRRWVGRGLGLAGLAAAAFLALGGVSYIARKLPSLPSFGSGDSSYSASGERVYVGDRYTVYSLGGGAEVVRPHGSPHVYDIAEDGNHTDIDRAHRGRPHLHRARADALVTVRDLDSGRQRVVSQPEPHRIRP